MFRSIATAATAGPSRLGPLLLSRGFRVAAVAGDKRPAAPRLKQGLPADSAKARQVLSEETRQWIEGMYGGEGSWAPQNAEAAVQPAAASWDATIATLQHAPSKEERTQRRRERRANKRGRDAQARAARVAVAAAADPAEVAGNTLTCTGGEGDPTAAEPQRAPARRWEPTRKLTYAAMAGVRELHAQDPQTWTRAALAEKFGISFEAVGRILRSKWHDKRATSASATALGMGKWAKGESSDDSPVPYIRAVYDLKRRSDAGEGRARTRLSPSKPPKDP